MIIWRYILCTLINVCIFLNILGANVLHKFNTKFRHSEFKIGNAQIIPQILFDDYIVFSGVSKFLYENNDIGWNYKRVSQIHRENIASFTHVLAKSNKIEGFHVILAEK